MILRVDVSSSVPVYAQIVAQVKRAIASGVMRPSEFLPSLRDAAGMLRINPLTVAKAYRELEVMGLVRTDHGKGTYVIHEAAQISRAQRRSELLRLADQLVIEGYHLGADTGEIKEAVDERLTQMRPEFETRDARMEEHDG